MSQPTPFLSRGAILVASSLLVNLGNYGFNLLAGRLVAPASYGEISLLVTLVLALSFAAMGFQLTATRFPGARGLLTRLAWRGGGAAAVLLLAGAGFLQDFFHLSSPWPVCLVALAIPLFWVMSVGRGVLQGQLFYAKLAGTYQLELWVRAGLGLGLLALGFGPLGVAIGLVASLVAAFFLTLPHTRRPPAPELLSGAEARVIYQFFGVTIAYELSQILINNSDVLLVKHFFGTHEAGLYAALAMIGRVVYFGTWSVVMVLFPAVIEQQRRGLPTAHLFRGSLALVGGIAACLVVACYLFPEAIVRLLFGSQYLAIGVHLWAYAAATALFALANVFVYYHLSFSRRGPVVLAALAGLVQVVLIWLFHGSLATVVLDQVVAMAALVLSLGIYQAWVPVFSRPSVAENAGNTSLQCRPLAA